jgi:ribosome maturation factor RimP
MRDELTEKVKTLVMSLVREASLELIELNARQQGKTVIVDIVADRADGGITIDECAALNKTIDRAVEKRQWFVDGYIVQVASPGLDRPLKTVKDFLRVLGRQVRVHLVEPVDGKLEHHGEIKDVGRDQVMIKINEKAVIIPLTHIAKAVQVIA